jgi:hypothetical protein
LNFKPLSTPTLEENRMNRFTFRTGLLYAAFGFLATQAVPSLASSSDPSSGNASSAPAAAAAGPINQGKSMKGTWNLSYDWGCTGFPGSTIWTVNKNGTFTAADGGGGPWTQSGKSVTLTYDGGGAVYVGKVTATTAKGTMSAFGSTGCWTATR